MVAVFIYVRTKKKASKPEPELTRAVAYATPDESKDTEQENIGGRRASVIAPQSVGIVTRAKFEAAAAMYRLDVSTVELEDSSQPATAKKTLAASYFKSLYDLARAPEDCVEILQTVGIVTHPIRHLASVRADLQNDPHLNARLSNW